MKLLNKKFDQKLKIIHVDAYPGWRGGEKQLIELMNGLISRGFNNVLFCKSSSEISKHAQKLGLEVKHLPFKGEWDLLSAYKLRLYIKRENIDIVHVHDSHAHTIAFFALLGLNSCKLVVARRVDFHLHSFFSRKFKYAKVVSKIISVSNAVKNILISDGIDPDLIVTIRDGFVPNTFDGTDKKISQKSKFGLDENSVVITTVAALAPHKAHHVLLKAASLVVKKHPGVKFILAGEGEMRPRIEKDIANLDLSASVLLLGFVKDIGSVYMASDIFAISSSEEGLCSSILDAMYFDLPIVATSAGGIPEIVQDKVNGFIVPVYDYMAFAERLNVLIESPERRKKMGLRSSDILMQNTVEHTIENTISVYQKLFD